MKNLLLKNIIETMIITLKNFINSCTTMTKKDDGIKDKEEEQQLKKIKKATEKYINELKRISR